MRTLARWRAIAPLAILVVASCATPLPAGPLTGSWGARHVGLVLDPAGGTLDYDCAAGRIDGPILVGAGGSFTANGSHTPATGGPERVDQPRQSHPATYRGTVRGDRLTLQVRLANGQLLGPFELRRGVAPTLMRCL